MRLSPALLSLVFVLTTGGRLVAFSAPQSSSANNSAERECELGRQQIEELKTRDHVGPIILSRDPVTGYNANLLSIGTEPKNRVPIELEQAWKRQPKTNLLDACPELAAISGVRLAVSTDDIKSYGSHTTIYYFSAPVFNRARDEALLVEGFYCSGRCGGYSINHYQWSGTRWDRKVPLFWMYG